ncbi:MAG: glycosyltransferase family 4 protein [Anaerolineales bacterium]
MRIALSGWFWNRPETGSGQYLRELLRVLTLHHPETEFLLVAPPDRFDAEAALFGGQRVPLPAPPAPLGKLWWEQVLLPRLARRLRVDLLHVPYWAPPLVSPVPTLVTVHDLIPRLLPAYRGGLHVRAYTALVSAATPRATLVLTDSQAACTDIVAHLNVAPEKVRVVYLATSSRYHPEPRGDERVLAKYALEAGYTLYLGGFDVRKNLSALLRAFKRVDEALGGEVRLVVAGRLPARDSPFAPDPRRLAGEAHLPEERVCFLGFVPEEEKPALYRQARAFVFTSRYEGFGLPPLEALASGTPVVGSDAASLPEVVGDAGVLTHPDDVAGMAGALIQLYTDEPFHRELSRRAVEQAGRFSWRRTAQETFAAYQEIVANLSPRRARRLPRG